MTNENTYKTKDLGEAGALLVLQQILLAVEKDEKVCWFIFNDKKMCESISNKFYFGELSVNARDYKEKIDRLKNRIFANY